MPKPKMRVPKSVKIYIRREKARIRKSGASLEEQRKLIEKLYENK